MDNLLIVILGPTGVGKSKTAVTLAERFNGDIINADSRQIYKYMDIGTAKPPAKDLAKIPHHLLSIINPDENYSLALYQKMAGDAIIAIHKKGKLPLLVGGSGQYIKAFTEGWQIPKIPPDYELRKELEARAKEEGSLKLYEELQRLDPDAAKSIDYKNIRRIIRAIEACKHSSTKFSTLRRKNPPPYKILKIGLTIERFNLYNVVDKRVNEMLGSGLIEEIKHIQSLGYSLELPSLNTIGYTEIGAYLKGEMSLDEAIQKIKYKTHRYIRQQYAWFKLSDESICWFDVQNPDTNDKIISIVQDFISREKNR